jgi:hypothetical protein
MYATDVPAGQKGLASEIAVKDVYKLAIHCLSRNVALDSPNSSCFGSFRVFYLTRCRFGCVERVGCICRLRVRLDSALPMRAFPRQIGISPCLFRAGRVDSVSCRRRVMCKERIPTSPELARVFKANANAQAADRSLSGIKPD